MPYISITTAGRQLALAEKQALVAETTRLVSLHLGKRREVTAVRIDDAGGASWGIGGDLLGEGEAAAHMEISITAGTNTDAEKAAMIEAGHAMMRVLLGKLPQATYVIVREWPAGNWGYGGLTQAARAAGSL
jgi:4-oxalocrotonate tautomerase